MNTKTLILTLFILVMAAAGLQAYQGGCPGTGHYQDFMAGLSPEQQEKVQKLTDAHHEQLFALQKDLSAKHAEMEALLAVVPPDKAAISTLMDDVNALQAKKNALNADYRISLTEITGKPLPLDSGKGCGPASPCPGRTTGCGAPSSEAGNGDGAPSATPPAQDS
jgi:zinc resistance-associated protein